MSWFKLLAKPVAETRLAELADRIAVETRHRVWQKVRQRAPYLGPAEIRGYVRARVATIIHSEVARVLASEAGVRRSQHARLIELANDAVTRLVAIQVRAMSFSSAGVRAAA